MKTHVKKGDSVTIISGGHKGKSGTILAVNPAKSQVTIQGVHLIKKHVKKTQTSEGGIIEKEGPVHISNVRLAVAPAKAEAAVAPKAAAKKTAAKKAPAKKRAKADAAE